MVLRCIPVAVLPQSSRVPDWVSRLVGRDVGAFLALVPDSSTPRSSAKALVAQSFTTQTVFLQYQH